MKWAARILVITLSLTGSRAIFLSTSSCACPMGGDMACCLVGATSDAAACTLRSCGGTGDAVAAAAAAPPGLLPPTVILPKPSFRAPVSISAEAFPLSLSDAPPAPPPRA